MGGVRTKSAAERRTRRAAALARYADTPRGKYKIHKMNAKRRGIAFLLTFDQWFRIWRRSGHWDARGNKSAAGYVMSRRGDEGAYADGNVEIVTHAENVAERNRLHFAAGRYFEPCERDPGAPGPDVPF